MSDTFIIEGGKPLTGTVVVSGAKNVALKTIIASLLFDSPVELHNVPHIRDVDEILHLLTILGAHAEFIASNKIRIDPRTLKNYTVDLVHGSRIRTSFLLFAPLLYVFGKAEIPNPGGCRLGARSIDRAIEGMRQLGVDVTYNHTTGFYQANMKHKPKGRYSFEKSTHTGTEFLILLSVFCEGSIVIENAALEPEIDDLIAFLNNAGANIKRNKTEIIIKGVQRLQQNNPFSIIGDRNQAVTYAILGIATKGNITVKGVHVDQLTTFLNRVSEVGGKYRRHDSLSIEFSAGSQLSASAVETTPHPGFMTDWQPNWAVLMTQAQGVSTIHERIFENRFAYVSELQKLGAKIEFESPQIANPQAFYYFNYDSTKKYTQAIRITGPQNLHNGILTIADLRAGATLAIAALLVPGESAINNVSILERGYEHFIDNIRAIGGKIKKI